MVTDIFSTDPQTQLLSRSQCRDGFRMSERLEAEALRVYNTELYIHICLAYISLNAKISLHKTDYSYLCPYLHKLYEI